jgi:hypothetical protein
MKELCWLADQGEGPTWYALLSHRFKKEVEEFIIENPQIITRLWLFLLSSPFIGFLVVSLSQTEVECLLNVVNLDVFTSTFKGCRM